MKLIPILFSTAMVQSILAGAKTQTRRVIKTQPPTKDFLNAGNAIAFNTEKTLNHTVYCPYGKVSDVLWVRETFYAFGIWKKNDFSKSGKQKWKFHDETLANGFNYQYVDTFRHELAPKNERGWHKRPSLFMPKSACRIFLKRTNTSVERLQDIKEDDAISEGVERHLDGWMSYDIIKTGKHKGTKHPWNVVPYKSAWFSFQSLWQSINGQQSWNDNPFVWVISFEKIDKPTDFV